MKKLLVVLSLFSSLFLPSCSKVDSSYKECSRIVVNDNIYSPKEEKRTITAYESRNHEIILTTFMTDNELPLLNGTEVFYFAARLPLVLETKYFFNKDTKSMCTLETFVCDYNSSYWTGKVYGSDEGLIDENSVLYSPDLITYTYFSSNDTISYNLK